MKSDALNVAAVIAGVALLAAGGPWLVGQLRTLPAPTELAARGNDRIVTLEVGGMTCEACESAIHGQLSQVPGVNAVEIRRPEGRAYVVCEANVADSVLTGAVRRAGGGFVATVTLP